MVLHGCECWTLSRAVCDKLNDIVFRSRSLRTILSARWQDHVSNEMLTSAQLVRFCRLSWAGLVLRHNELIVHEVMFSRADSNRRGRLRTLVADLSDDISHVCNFFCRPLLITATQQRGVQPCLLTVRDLGCFNCPNCAKTYISATRNTSADALSPLGRSPADFDCLIFMFCSQEYFV